ncbi:MAG: hypothetical protein LBT25_10705 [Candidatus Symbiothrix sp.]|jgi:hypothetical protein|nr:hypothetical protein [Candidatus Symbiothrix sp.]
MKKILLFLAFIFATSHLFSQSIECEIINFGCAFGFQKDKIGNTVGRPEDPKIALSFGTEIRCNLLDKKLSPGLQFTFSGWGRNSSSGGYANTQNAHIFLAVTDYNFTEVHPKIMPFVGAGLGCSIMRDWGGEAVGTTYYSHFACCPRVGVEFFKRLRLTTEYQYIGNRNSFFNIKLGFVVGS